MGRWRSACWVAFEAILARFEAEFHGDWKTAAAGWQEQLQFIQAARPGAQDARQDRLYAEIIAKEAEPYIGFTWSVRDLFKHAGRGAYYWFDVEEEKKIVSFFLSLLT